MYSACSTRDRTRGDPDSADVPDKAWEKGKGAGEVRLEGNCFRCSFAQFQAFRVLKPEGMWLAHTDQTGRPFWRLRRRPPLHFR